VSLHHREIFDTFFTNNGQQPGILGSPYIVAIRSGTKKIKDKVPFSWRPVSYHPSWLCRLHLLMMILLMTMMMTTLSLLPVSPENVISIN